MIASVNGTIAAIDGGSIVVEVSGVGYLVQVTAATANSLRLNDSVLLFTSFIVKNNFLTFRYFSYKKNLKICKNNPDTGKYYLNKTYYKYQFFNI